MTEASSASSVNPPRRLGMTEHELLNQIKGDEHALDGLRHAYLECAGWTYTCKTPGAIWMWERVIDGVTYRVSQGDALRMQEHMSPEPESDDGE